MYFHRCMQKLESLRNPVSHGPRLVSTFCSLETPISSSFTLRESILPIQSFSKTREPSLISVEQNFDIAEIRNVNFELRRRTANWTEGCSLQRSVHSRHSPRPAPLSPAKQAATKAVENAGVSHRWRKRASDLAAGKKTNNGGNGAGRTTFIVVDGTYLPEPRSLPTTVENHQQISEAGFSIEKSVTRPRASRTHG